MVMKSARFRDEILQRPPIIICPSSGWVPLKLDDLWEHRELVFFLAWRDLKVRYKQTVLGVVWVILQPLLMTLVFTVVFGRFVAPTSDGSGVPYPLFAFCGLLPWQFFAYVLNNSSNSLVASERLITKVYFPRLVIPLSGVLSGLVDFAVAFAVLIGMIFYYRIAPTQALWLLPCFLLLALACAVGVGLWLAALTIQYRDVRLMIPFMSQVWFFMSPVAYPVTLVAENWRWLFGLNPMAGVIQGLRWSLVGGREMLGAWVWLSVVVTAMLLVSGLYYFRGVERHFADVV
jgi:lipopolysaccharide transport system permease protein